MKKTIFICSSLSVALLLALIGPAGAQVEENRHLGSIRQELEASTLSQPAQAEVRTRAAAAIQAGLPAEDVAIIVTRGLGRGADGATIGRFLDAGLQVRGAGLSAGPVLDRIEQGLAKGVALDKIAAAATGLAEKMQAAQPIVDDLIGHGLKPKQNTERESAIGSAARALEKAVAPEDVAALGMAVRDADGPLRLFAGAADTATYFAGTGMAPKTAARLVLHAVEKGFTQRDLDRMVKQMDAELRQGTRAEDAAARMDRDTMQRDRDRGRQDMRTDQNRGAGSGMGGRGR
jgi:NAD(P)H-hydrate repair Nnr-like enzyme with NAD(P)H-hydrate epimerase domain